MHQFEQMGIAVDRLLTFLNEEGGSFNCPELDDHFDREVLNAAQAQGLIQVFASAGNIEHSVYLTRKGKIEIGVDPGPTMGQRIKTLVQSLLSSVKRTQ